MKWLIFLVLICLLLFSGCIYHKSEDYFTLDLINEAKARILAENPGVELEFFEFIACVHEDHLDPPQLSENQLDQGGKKLEDIVWWGFVFCCDNEYSAIIEKFNGEWSASQIVYDYWAGDSVIVTDYLRIDFDEAIEILKIYLSAEPTEDDLFEYVYFRKPLFGNHTEPYYIFQIGENQFVFVGAITGEVTVEFQE